MSSQTEVKRQCQILSLFNTQPLQLVTASMNNILYYYFSIEDNKTRIMVCLFYVFKLYIINCTIIGQFTRLLRSLELRAVSHRTVLLLRDQKLLFRMRYCFEGSKVHLPTL